MISISSTRAALLGIVGIVAAHSGVVQALPYNAHADYQVNVTADTFDDASATGVDILQFLTVDNVGVGIHAYSAGSSFGARASADFLGTSAADVTSRTFVDLNDLGSSLTLDVTPGEISAHGPAGGMLGADNMSGALVFAITLDDTLIYRRVAEVSLDSTTAVADPDVANLAVGPRTLLNLGMTCSSSLLDGDASCILGGGATTLDLDALSPGKAAHHLTYVINALVSGLITDFSGCSGSGGNGEVFATAAIIGGVEGGGGGGEQCGVIARSGDPVPEPATLALAPLALTGVAAARRRQRRAD